MKRLWWMATGAAAAPLWVSAADEPALSSGDMAYVAFATLLVLLMTPAVGLFYGGLVRRKNSINTMMMSFICLAIFTVQWYLFGYSLAFGHDIGGVIGGGDKLLLHGVGMAADPEYSETIPAILFCMFQMAFAILTPAIVSGGIVERTRFAAWCVFIFLWGTLVYDPMCHMVWGVGGWIREMGGLDFAGGTVIHITSGFSALTAAILIGRRRDYGTASIRPHNIPYVIIGATLLWIGWFGFNSGAGLTSSDIMAQALGNTGIASCTAGLVWAILEKMHHDKVTAVGFMTGIIAGLVGITPAAGFVDSDAAFFIGLTTPIVSYIMISFVKTKFGYDDSLDVFGCHGMGGVWGAVMTGVFCTTEINPGGADGLLYGNPAQLIPQVTGILVAMVMAVGVTAILVKLVGAFMHLRATDSEESQGLDLIEHGERAYSKM